VVRQVDPTTIPRTIGETRPPGTCQVGNLNPSYWAIGSWLQPIDRYALVFDPTETCLDCTYGIKVTSVHVLLQTSSDCGVTMKVGFMNAPLAGDCYEPGLVQCLTPEYVVDLPNAGLWDISLPLDCTCADPSWPQALKIVIVGADCGDGSVPDLVTDDLPANCVSWMDTASIWEDLVAVYGFPGNLKIWADAECCWQPVGAERRTWGGLKTLYR
jgi:hypothetical protein